MRQNNELQETQRNPNNENIEKVDLNFLGQVQLPTLRGFAEAPLRTAPTSPF